MKPLYPSPERKTLFTLTKPAIIMIAFVLSVQSSFSQTLIPELVFKNAVLESGSDRQDGAIYRFPNVATGIDALVKINGRSSTNVVLNDLDMSYTGYENAFQPLVDYKNGNHLGSHVVTDWYIEFQISFVHNSTSDAVSVSGFNVTGLDNDGSTNLREYLSFYNLNTYTLENPTGLAASSIMSGSTVVGKRFDGCTTEYDGIDITATKAMVTNQYVSTSSFAVRVGGKATGPINISNNGRQHSLWFKKFTYSNPVVQTLPITLADFTARLNNKNVLLNWATDMENNASHFTIERSVDGKSFDDAAIVFAEGNSSVRREYSFKDDVSKINSKLVYYRLKMVDMDARYKYSEVVLVRMAGEESQTNVLVFPNPAVNELRISIPYEWQNKTVSYTIYNSGGTMVKQKVNSSAGQTETMHVADLPPGIYLIKTNNGSQTAVQKFIKAN